MNRMVAQAKVVQACCFRLLCEWDCKRERYLVTYVLAGHLEIFFRGAEVSRVLWGICLLSHTILRSPSAKC